VRLTENTRYSRGEAIEHALKRIIQRRSWQRLLFHNRRLSRMAAVGLGETKPVKAPAGHWARMPSRAAVQTNACSVTPLPQAWNADGTPFCEPSEGAGEVKKLETIPSLA
jgi:hypothetical protein